MKSIGFFIVFIICSVFIYKAASFWQRIGILDKRNIQVQKKIKDLEKEVGNLKSLSDAEVGSLEDNYRNLDEQIHLFVRMHHLKMSVAAEKLKADGAIVSAAHDSRWMGINQLDLSISFYSLQELGQYIRILRFFKSLEESLALKICSIAQKGNQLQVGVYLYGR